MSVRPIPSQPLPPARAAGSPVAKGHLPRTTGFYRSTLGKKVVVAVTGVVLLGYVLLHMLGNLQIYLGPDRLNAYAETLRRVPALLWGARIVLLLAVVAHIVATVQLTAENWGSRPRYERQRYRDADPASRTMILSGPVIAAFVVYHVLHFTTGDAHPSFRAGDVYHNVVAGFSSWPVSAVYIVANLLLALHLYHGVWSMFQTLGVSHPAWDPLRRVLATAFTAAIAIGNVSIPLAVLFGVVR